VYSKQRIEISSTLAELFTLLAKSTLDSCESDAMFSEMFESVRSSLEKYKSDTIDEIYGNLIYVEEVIDLLNTKK
jgi:hypothetical protein